MLIVMICLNSCTSIDYNYCTTYPLAGQKVAEELERIPYKGYENFWEWLARINKLKQELEISCL